MRYFLIFIIFISIFIQSVLSQNFFKVSEIDSSQDKDNIRIFEGEVLPNDECHFDFANEKFRERDRLHIILEDIVISVLPKKDKKLNLDYFFYGPNDLTPSHIGPQYNNNQFHRYDFDVICSGRVYITSRLTGFGYRGKIKDGEFIIRYDYIENSMTIIMEKVLVEWRKKGIKI